MKDPRIEATNAGYDLIGDVHGHADELRALLADLGYRERGGALRHPERTAVFVGDFLDRGPKIAETLRLVRAMLEAESALAVLGNHEWNHFAYAFEDPDLPGEFLRRHTERNARQVASTFAQVESGDLASHLAFFRKLPIRLSLPGLRVVHACWDEVAFAVIDEGLARHGCDDRLTDDFLIEGSNPESLLFAALEIALKGKEMELPVGTSFLDKDGEPRLLSRVRWFESVEGHDVASYCLPGVPGIPAVPLPSKVRVEARPYPTDAPTVFFGHYWLDAPAPAPLAPNVVCLDYSVAKGGFLCAYRWASGPIEPARFVRAAAAK
jgi:hypothetical protein